MDDDFFKAVSLWSTVDPYKDFPCQTIAWRLMPAFLHKRYKMWYNADGSCRGFVIWAWMTAEEFETRLYSGEAIFSRDTGERLVFVDMIAPKGVSDVLYFSRDLRKLFKVQFPDVETVWSHRGPRTGWYPNKGG